LGLNDSSSAHHILLFANVK